MMKTVCSEAQDNNKTLRFLLFVKCDLSASDLYDVHAGWLCEARFGPVSPDCLLCFLCAHYTHSPEQLKLILQITRFCIPSVRSVFSL